MISTGPMFVTFLTIHTSGICFSTDMLGRVARMEFSYNNKSAVARSKSLSQLKLLYYKLFAYIYGKAGR